MTTVTLDGRAHALEPNESVLDGLLRVGVKVPYACRAGACQSCVMRAVSGTVPAASQVGLKETMKARGYFLSCLCKPAEDLELKSAGDDLRVPAVISALDKLSESVVRVRLRPSAAWDYRPGQYASIHRADGLARSYSIASLPGDEAIEMHVRKVRSGRMSGWLYDEARVGDTVHLQGPSGECFYVPGRPEQPLLLAGTGTGLAPLYGVLRDALASGHTGPIWLFHGALDSSGLYLTEEIRAIAAQSPQVCYRPCVVKGEPTSGLSVGLLDKLILAEHPKLAGWRAFLCGNPELTLALKKRVFLAGAPMKDIYADPFLASAA